MYIMNKHVIQACEYIYSSAKLYSLHGEFVAIIVMYENVK